MPVAPQVGILGATGFVGSTIARMLPDAHNFNSRNAGDAEKTRFETLYCAAAPGSMFEANKHPERDAVRIDALIASLSRMRAERFVLISTIAVLDRFDGGYTEEDARYQQTTPYGVNRRRLEVACRAHFPRCMIVRLPALFGPGLAKNFVFDLMNPMPTMLNGEVFEQLFAGLPTSLKPALGAVYTHDDALGMHVIDRAKLADLPERAALTKEADRLGINSVMFHSRKTTYQFYQMSCLVEDVALALGAGLDVVHLAPAPLKASEIHLALKGEEMPQTNAKSHAEDMRTVYAGLWNMLGPYNRSPTGVLTALTRFYRSATDGGT